MKKWIHRCTVALGVIVAAVWGLTVYMMSELPSQCWVTSGGSMHVSPLVSAVSTVDANAVVATADTVGSEYTVTFRLFHCIPIKSAVATVVDTPLVVPCGTPFGIKMYTEGVLVVGMSDVDTPNGLINPARRAGIRVGDVILRIDDTEVNTTAEVSRAISECGGRVLSLRVRRNNLEFTVRFTPVRATDRTYKAGLWVRDSSAGIGTMTFFEPQTNRFAGLGHGVSDVDTGELLPISGGEIVPARIFDVVAGVSGTPGELCGMFESGVLGILQCNRDSGVYGTLESLPTHGQAIPLALKQQVHKGDAQILSTIDGNTPSLYDVYIEQVRLGDGASGRHMVLVIVDEELLSRTGGIVQGMSGSPIIQDGKLVGAVTHVFVNDPTRGYGIFAETMYQTTQSIAEEQQLKDAS